MVDTDVVAEVTAEVAEGFGTSVFCCPGQKGFGKMSCRVCVVGAGIVGLSTALRIKEIYRSLVHVTVIASDFGPDTTSYVAAGSSRLSTFPKIDYNGKSRPLARDVEVISYDKWADMLNSSEADKIGIHKLQSYEIFCPGVAIPEKTNVYQTLKENRQQLSDEQLYALLPNLPPGCTGSSFTSMVLSPASYLPWLTARFTEMGGVLRRGTVGSFDELWPSFDVVMNCSGLGARSLAGDTSVIPIRGQLFRLKIDDLEKTSVYIHDGTEKPPYYAWTPDGVALGGVKAVGSGDLIVRKADSDLIKENAQKFFPWLNIEEENILREEVGLRPYRPAIRLEMEEHNYRGTKKWVIHNYGHGGSGIYLSWGTSCVAVDMLSSIIVLCKL